MPYQKFAKTLQQRNSPSSEEKRNPDKKAHEGFKEYVEHRTDETRLRWLRDVLDERSSDVVIQKSSKVLTDKVSHAETLVHWINDKQLDQPAEVQILAITAERGEEAIDQASRGLSNLAITKDIEQSSYTHAIFRIVEKATAPKTLQLLHEALTSNGVALVECLKRNPTLEVHLRVLEMQSKDDDPAKANTVERVREIVKANNFADGELVELAVETGFERAKVRSFPKKSNIDGEKLRKWTAEVKAQMSCGKYPELEPWVDKAIKDYMEENGGMAVETELLMVTR